MSSHSIVVACDEGNYAHVSEILGFGSSSVTTALLPPQEILKQAFQIALGQQHFEIMKLFLTPSRPHPFTGKLKPVLEMDFIDETFHEQFVLGLYPELIQLLQEYCSTEELATVNRIFMKNNYYNKYKESYLVNPTELEQLKTWQSLQDKKKKLTDGKSLIPHRERLKEMLRIQFKINNFLYDCCFCNWRYVTNIVLLKSNVLTPSQDSLNEVFYFALTKHHFTYAAMVCLEEFDDLLNHKSRLRVTQQGINSAFTLLLHDEDYEALEWLLLNNYEIRPSFEMINQGYYDLRISDYRETVRQEDEMMTAGRRPRLAQRMLGALQVGWRRRLTRNQREEARLEMERKASFHARFSSVVSAEMVEKTNAELAQLTERRNRIVQARHRMRGGARTSTPIPAPP